MSRNYLIFCITQCSCIKLTGYFIDNTIEHLVTTYNYHQKCRLSPNSADKNVEMWKIKKLIKSLEAARGFVYYYPNLLVYKFYLFLPIHK